MSMTEVVVILVVGLLVLGPDRLPGIAKGLGKAMREFRKATREIQTTLQVEEVRRTLRGQFDDEDEDDDKGAVGKPPTPEGDPTTDPKDEIEARRSPPPPPKGDDPTSDPKDELPKPTVGPGPRPRAVPRPPPAGAVATGVFRPLQASTRRGESGETEALPEAAAAPSLEAPAGETSASAEPGASGASGASDAADAAAARAEAEAERDEERLRAYLEGSDRDADDAEEPAGTTSGGT